MYQCAGVPVYQGIGVLVYRCTGVPVCCSTGVPVYWVTCVLVCAGVPVYLCIGAEYDRKGEGIADLDISRIQYHDTTGQRAQTDSSEITHGSQ